jgi:hypothetical protein
MSGPGHQRRFKRKPRTPAFPPIPDISLRRTAWRAIKSDPRQARRIAANIAKLPELLSEGRTPRRPPRAALAEPAGAFARSAPPGSTAVDSTFRPLYRPACELPVNTGCFEVTVPGAGHFAALCRRQAPEANQPAFGNRAALGMGNAAPGCKRGPAPVVVSGRRVVALRSHHREVLA